MAILGRQLAIVGEAPRLGNLQNAEMQNAGGGGGGGGTGQINLNNILLLIPGDVVSIYMIGKGLVGNLAGATPPFIQAHWLAIVFWTCVAACGLVRIIASKPEGQVGLLSGVNWSLVIVTTLAFFIWAHAVSDVAPVIPGFVGSFAGFFAMILGLFAPRFVKAEGA